MHAVQTPRWRGDVTPDSLAGQSSGRRSSLRPTVLLAFAFWLMLWGGYNTGIYVLLAPNFPTGPVELFHGLRCLLPILAAWLAGLLLLRAENPLAHRVIAGPLGLLAFYTLIGLVSSGLSRQPIQALYWAATYGSVLIVLWAIASDADPASTLSSLLTLNWVIAAAIMVGLLAAIPFLGDQALARTEGSPFGVVPYRGGFAASGQILGMASTRNTGFARYAAVTGLAALGRLWQGKTRARFIWAAVLLVSLYSLVLSQGRTQVVAFIVGAFVLLWLQRARRLVFVAGTVAASILMGLTGFQQVLWKYLTRLQEFDPTLTGRTETWRRGWELFQQSPWIGLGFQADRFFLEGKHMHDALFHALVQAGLLGTLAFVGAYVVMWFLVVRVYVACPAQDLASLAAEVPGVLAFFTISSVTESTFAFFGAAWLLTAPVLAYLQVEA